MMPYLAALGLALVAWQQPSATYNDMFPAWSPDGRQIVFDIHVMNLDGTARRRLTTLGLEHGLPVFSPDGTRILFQKADQSGSRIWIVDRDGREARPIDTGGR